MKQKIVFALLMGSITTGLISFTVVSLNMGFIENFWKIWLKSWVIAYLVVISCILIIAPKVQLLVDLFFKEKDVSNDER